MNKQQAKKFLSDNPVLANTPGNIHAERAKDVLKHTEGPWNMQKLGMTRHYFEINAKGAWIADVKGPSNNEQGEANAKLIAAAPELLAFAEMIKGQCDDGYLRGDHFSFIKKAVEQAIKKATGAN